MKIGTIGGIKIKLHYSTIVIILMVGFSAGAFYQNSVLGESIYDTIIFGFIAGIGVLISIFAHEIMHSIVAISKGLKVEEIELYLFGGVAKIESEPTDPINEIKMAIAGPLTSLVIGFIALMLGNFAGFPYFSDLSLIYLGFVNLSLGLFNLIPAFPMDGGRVLRAILWKKRGDQISATRTSARIGELIGNIFLYIGVIQIFFLYSFDGFWFIILGNYLASSAKNAYYYAIILDKLKTVQIFNIMQNIYPVIPENMPLETAARMYFARFNKNHYLVINDENEYIGILHVEKLKILRIFGRTGGLLHQGGLHHKAGPEKQTGMQKQVGFEKQTGIQKQVGLENQTGIQKQEIEGKPDDLLKRPVSAYTEPISNFPRIPANTNGKEGLELLQKRYNNTDLLIVEDNETREIIGLVELADIQKALTFLAAR